MELIEGGPRRTTIRDWTRCRCRPTLSRLRGPRRVSTAVSSSRLSVKNWSTSDFLPLVKKKKAQAGR